MRSGSRLFGCVLAWVACSCTAARVSIPAVPPSEPEVTIFLPGYRGTALVTDGAERERAYITVCDTLVRGHRSLALPFEGQRPVRRFGPLLPNGPLTRFTVIPYLVGMEIYQDWLEFGRERLPGFMVFDYDWRLDNREHARRLSALIERLAAERGGKLRVNLVAHSMGGLIALHALRYGTGSGEGAPTWAGGRYVRRAVFIGTPFAGAPGIFDDFFLGTPMGRNIALLSPFALFTFASAFQLLPRESDFFVDEKGQPVALDAYSPETWLARGWGIFQDASLKDEPAYRAQLERMLGARRDFAQALSPSEGAPPPFQSLVVVGTGRKLIESFRVVAGQVSFESPVLGDGDGSVLSARALPPPPLRYERLESKADHVALMSDEAVQEAVARFLTGP